MKIEKEDKKVVQKEMDEAMNSVLNSEPIILQPFEEESIEKIKANDILYFDNLSKEKEQKEEQRKKDLFEEILNSEPIKFIWEIAKALIRKKLKIKKED